MAFDGITIANIAQELNQTIVGGKINKIAQPENDELMITIKNNRTVYRLLLSASASLPLIYLTDNNKPGPPQTHRQRPHSLRYPAGTRAYSYF